MSAYLRSLATAVPDTVYPQPLLRDIIKAQPELGRLGQRLVSATFNGAAIDQRHSVVRDFLPGSGGGLFYDPETGTMLTPSTGTRNQVYIREVTPLFIEAGQRALQQSALQAADVTHVVTVSCTGFFAPGPDYAVVRALGLAPTVERYHVGFMGCYAAFPALKMAKAFCDARPDAVVLVICAELCTLHMHSVDHPDTIIANSVFADGAAAAVVSAAAPSPGQAALHLDAFETTLTPPDVGESDMAWTIGDQGYDMVLSTYVPGILAAHLDAALAPLFAHLPQRTAPHQEIQGWAVHPGGRSILDKVQSGLALSEAQMQPSRAVLRRFGNMSSATVLFILADLFGASAPEERICAMAFGPGLTVESGLMTRVTGT